jgi:hypothetical protein
MGLILLDRDCHQVATEVGRRQSRVSPAHVTMIHVQILTVTGDICTPVAGRETGVQLPPVARGICTAVPPGTDSVPARIR